MTVKTSKIAKKTHHTPINSGSRKNNTIFSDAFNVFFGKKRQSWEQLPDIFNKKNPRKQLTGIVVCIIMVSTKGLSPTMLFYRKRAKRGRT